MACRVAIVTDRVSDLPEALVERFSVRVVPVYLNLDGTTYCDDGTLDRDWFYRQLSQVTSRPTTSAPAPWQFRQAYEELATDGAEEILAILTASSVSSIYSHSQAAASTFDTIPVHIVDSSQVSMGVGWAVVEAAEQLAAGIPSKVVVQRLGRMQQRTRVLGLIDSIDYLRRSGRVSWISGAVAELLKIKPLIRFHLGRAELLGRVRTYAKGAQSLLSRVKTGRVARLALLHSRADAAILESAWETLSCRFPDLEIPVVDIGAVFATHVGPGCLGIAFVESE